MRLYFLISILILIFIIGCAQQQIQQKQEINQIEPEKQIETKTTEVVNMKLTSSAFKEGKAIPSEFTCDGDDISPQLTISDVPANTKSLALVCDDPDAPMGTWDHWVVFNIPANTKEIPKGTEPEGIGGKNSWGRTGYGGPCPPSGTHRYYFKLYALDTELDLEEGSGKKALEKAMKGHIIEKTQLMGTYKKS